VEVVETAEKAVRSSQSDMYGLTSSILAGDTLGIELAPKILSHIVNIKLLSERRIPRADGRGADSGGRTGRTAERVPDVIWINSISGQRQYPF